MSAPRRWASGVSWLIVLSWNALAAVLCLYWLHFFRPNRSPPVISSAGLYVLWGPHGPTPYALGIGAAIALALCVAVMLIARLRQIPSGRTRAWLALAPIGWCVLPLVGVGLDLTAALPAWGAALLASRSLWLSLPIAFYAACLWQAAAPAADPAKGKQRWLIAGVVLYGGTFALLGICQERALHVPHGDSGMYEEHLWNLLHGKGFRSQLDDGRLFFGEHFECIHLGLLPLYCLWPSLGTLMICKSAALGFGGWLVSQVGKRMGLAPAAAARLAVAYWLYFPLQYLDLEASWKAFRPEVLGVPIVLGAILAMEARRPGWFLTLVCLSWTAKEEYALVTAGIGLYFLATARRDQRDRPSIIVCGMVTAGSVIFLAVVIGWFLPYFRGGPAHYLPYFSSLGQTPKQIASAVVERPAELLSRIAAPVKLVFVAQLLVPLALVPLASPGRLAVAIPSLLYLVLADREGVATPWFHFHAPVIPILFWASAAGLAPGQRLRVTPFLSRLIVCLCLVTGLSLGRGPVSLAFYLPSAGVPKRTQPGGGAIFEPLGSYWRDLYLPNARSRAFAQAFATIDASERVAATDYIRNRFTHHRAAFDYPNLRQHVSIRDVDVIVLDKQEGWWGRGATNPDQDLLGCLRDAGCGPGHRLFIRGRPFVVIYHDPYFLVVRQDGS